MNRIPAEGHILIVNFPSEARVRQIVEEFHHDPTHRKREIALITDQVDELPATLKDLLFVRGSPLEADTYERANIAKAHEAIVLSPSYSDAHADSVVASALSVIAMKNPYIPTVGECLNEKHRSLFEAVSCDAVVSTFDLVNKLIVQESQDSGIISFLSSVASNRAEGTLFSLTVPKGSWSRNYAEFASVAVRKHINVIAVMRGNRSLTHLSELMPEEGDRVVYVADSRVTWEAYAT